MKITNELFLTAKKDKGIRSFMVRSGYVGDAITKEFFEGRPFIELCIETKLKYNDKTEMEWVQAETEIRMDNYSGWSEEEPVKRKKEVTRLDFHESVYGHDSHIRTFLNAIKKDSDVKFRAVLFNGCQAWNECQLVSHQLYGIVDEKVYFLSTYIGRDNSASPVKYKQY